MREPQLERHTPAPREPVPPVPGGPHKPSMRAPTASTSMAASTIHAPYPMPLIRLRQLVPKHVPTRIYRAILQHSPELGVDCLRPPGTAPRVQTASPSRRSRPDRSPRSRVSGLVIRPAWPGDPSRLERP